MAANRICKVLKVNQDNERLMEEYERLASDVSILGIKLKIKGSNQKSLYNYHVRILQTSILLIVVGMDSQNIALA